VYETPKPGNSMKQISITIMLALAMLGSASPTMAESHLQDIESKVAALLPGATVDRVAPSPLEGIYEVRVDGGDVVYVTEDARYLFSGVLIDLKTKENLTERVRSEQRLTTLNGVSEQSMIIFEPEGEVKHTITTFTDIDCPYCRKMHREIGLLNRMGIRVRYMFFPRAGLASPSYEKAVSVWCAEDQQTALTEAKAGATPKLRDCDNPVRKQMTLGRRLGLRGTPYTITDTGRAIGGYMSAPELLKTLEADKLRTKR
jgi:thiol:disulfide interchange protein DsbC